MKLVEELWLVCPMCDGWRGRLGRDGAVAENRLAEIEASWVEHERDHGFASAANVSLKPEVRSRLSSLAEGFEIRRKPSPKE